jgi:hypothetical protein
MKTFKTINQAMVFIKKINDLTAADIISINLELIKNKVSKVKGTYIFIDEFDILA